MYGGFSKKVSILTTHGDLILAEGIGNTQLREK
jgi:hypothetical protein